MGLIAQLPVAPAVGQVITTPTVPLELPVEIETELAPAGSLKQAPLWHEIAQLLEDPTAVTCPADDPATPDDESTQCTAQIVRRQSFGAQPLPPLNVWSPCFNVLTGQPLRLRTSDGEISWDQPGLLFGPDDGDPTTPVTEVIGNMLPDADGNLVVENLSDDPRLPPNGTIVAVPGCNAAGQPLELEFDVDGNFTGATAVILEFETPISELDLLRPATDVPPELASIAGRPAAQVLGKALFWDMQVGSDGVQACGSCHFHAGVDNRTKNQLNPNHLGGDLTLQLHGGSANQELTASDYPFHKLVNPDIPGEPLLNPENVLGDTNDVMSSMGVRFRQFVDIPAPGPGAFGPASGGVSALLPDLGAEAPDPIPVFQGLRRVEPRNTPTIFSAAFNFDNFWDGRARHDSNGGSVFGPVDPQFHVFLDPVDELTGVPSGVLKGASNADFRPDLLVEDPEVAEQPVRIRFSSLASLATGPALSDFEMSFAGRNWQKLGKKLLQAGVTPLANQLVATDDSLLGPYSNQGGSSCSPGSTAPGKPGLCISYPELIQLAFKRDLWANTAQHLDGTPAPCAGALNGTLTPPGCDPFDGYVLGPPIDGAADPTNTNQFTQMEANFSLFFGQSIQIWQEVLIPDDTPFDRFMDANPLAANGVGQPGEQGVLPPSAVPGLVGTITLVEGFGEDELFGFDVFSGANLTAALPVGSARNPAGMGSNPFLRSARCMICHLGPEQTDHTNNVNAGLLHSGTEFELPPPGEPEPTGVFRLVTGAALAEEVEENAQDGVEVENRNFAIVDDPATAWDDRQIAVPNGIAFQDNGVYNIGVRPTSEDIMRGGTDAFGWPLSLAAMALKNLGGVDFEPCDVPGDAATHPTGCAMPAGTDPAVCVDSPACAFGSGLFEHTGADQLVNPGLAMEPAVPQLPPYLAPWANNLPAGELHPEIDELAFAPNTITSEPPFAEFSEILFSSDTNCGVFDPAQFGNVAPNFGWGPSCPNSQSAIPNNFAGSLNGTAPVPNRVGRMGAVKAPQLRNIELTGPYFHNGGVLTLRQVIDFYMRGGDFPMTNAEHRDPNLVDVGLQAFGFGTTVGLPPQFQDGAPDVITQYGSMPDTASATPEYATPEDAKVSLVKLLLAMTDARVKFERAPFDHPEVIVPLDGTAPDNTGGRDALLADARFRVVPAVGAGGNATPLPSFLGISSTPVPGDNNDHFDRQPIPAPAPPPPGGLVTPNPGTGPGPGPGPGPSAPVAAAARSGGGCSSTAGGGATALLLAASAVLLGLRRRRER